MNKSIFWVFFFILTVLIGVGLLPVQVSAVTFQQTTITTSTVGQTNVTSGGSVFTPFQFSGASTPLLVSGGSVFNPFPVSGSTAPLTSTGGSIFNPFPLLGGSAPLATSPTTFNVSPVVGNAPPTPATGISVFNPFPLTGGTAPLAAPVQPFTSTTVGSSAPLVSTAAGGTSRPAAQNGSALNSVTGAGITTTTTSTTGATSGTVPTFQSTVTTTIPLSLSLTRPSSTAASSSTGVALALTAAGDPISTTRVLQNPEPSTLILFVSGFAALGWYGRRRRSAIDNQARRNSCTV